MISRALDILLAEDSEDDVFLLRQAFKRAGVGSRLHTVNDGLQALAYFKGEGAYANRAAFPWPDLVLLDLNMPQMNGFEVLEWMRQDVECKRLMVHVLTASSRPMDVQRAYDLHANSYVVKPTRVEELVGFVTVLHDWHGFVSLADRTPV